MIITMMEIYITSKRLLIVLCNILLFLSHLHTATDQLSTTTDQCALSRIFYKWNWVVKTVTMSVCKAVGMSKNYLKDSNHTALKAIQARLNG